MIARWIAGWIAVPLLCVAGCKTAPNAPAKEPASRPSIATDDPESWQTISKTLGKEGVYAREVYTITIPRDDLPVTTDIGEIPTAAGLDTTFHFFKCACGRMSATGRFVVADYEANDVIDELQVNGTFKIASLSPILLRDKPRVMAIQFQGEGDPETLAKVLKGALSYTADERMAPQKSQD